MKILLLGSNKLTWNILAELHGEKVVLLGNNPVTEEFIKEHKVGLIIAAKYGKLVPKEIVNKVRCLNIHCAPIERYRGFNSSFWAIWNGDLHFGVTIHEMDEGPDSGPVILKSNFLINNTTDTNFEIYQRANRVAYELFKDNLFQLVSGDYSRHPQRELAPFYSKSNLPERRILSIKDVGRYSRAFYFPPFEPAYFLENGVKFYTIPNISQEYKGKGGNLCHLIY